MRPSSSLILADSEFEELLDLLPEETGKLAREFRALCYSRKIRTWQQLLRMVLLYCGLDRSLREVGENMTLLGIRLSDTAVQKRLLACGPWLQALLKVMFGIKSFTSLQARRMLLVDASVLSVRGSKGSDYLLHVCIDLLSLTFVELWVSRPSEQAENLKNFELLPTDLVIGDAGFPRPRARNSSFLRGELEVFREE